MKEDRLQSLLAIESDYVSSIETYTEALKGIRFAIAIERGLGLTPSVSKHPVANKEIRPDGWLTGLSNKAAAQAVLEKCGTGMKRPDLFQEMKSGGHSINSERALSVALSSSPLFATRNGMWFLASTLPAADKDSEHEIDLGLKDEDM